MNFLLLAGFPQIKKSTFWRLRGSRKSKKALLGVCGVPANRKKHFWAFAGFPQAKKKRFGICGTPASIYKVGGLQDGERKYALEPSMPKLSVLFSICGNPANAKNYFFRFAGTPQAPKTTFFDLRESRKGQKVLFLICGNPADNKKFIFPSAGLPQAPQRAFCRSQGRCKRLEKLLAFAIPFPALLRRLTAIKGRIGAEASAKSVYFCPYFIR